MGVASVSVLPKDPVARAIAKIPETIARNGGLRFENSPIQRDGFRKEDWRERQDGGREIPTTPHPRASQSCRA